MTAPTDALLLEQQLCFALYRASRAVTRAYGPLLEPLGLTYPQYLVLNVLWRDDEQTVGAIATQLALESSTLTPLLKRLESAELVHRTRNPDNERQVVVGLTDKGRALRKRAGCLGEAMLTNSGQSPKELGELNAKVRQLRDAIYSGIEGWTPGV